MKRTFVLVLALLLGVLGRIHYDAFRLEREVHHQQIFAAQAKAASGAIFLNEKGKRRFICSGTLFAYTPDGDGLFATARHCIWNDADPEEDTEAGLMGNEEVSFSDNEAGPYFIAAPYKISNTDDVAILLLKNAAGLPAVRFGTEANLSSGNPLLNFGFGFDLGKTPLPMQAVLPAFAHYDIGIIKVHPEWAHTMPVLGSALPGASGSGLFDSRQQALVGLMVGATPAGGVLSIAEPISRVWALLGDPSLALDFAPALKTVPASTVAPNTPATALTIPDADFQRLFGEQHQFKLTTHGPSPVFTFGGYTFKVETNGFELYDAIWYAVPVFVQANGPGTYLLVSTKKPGYSVVITVVSKGV